MSTNSSRSFQKLARLFFILASLVGLSIALLALRELWRGDRETITWVVTGIGFLVLFLAIRYVGGTPTSAVVEPNQNYLQRRRAPDSTTLRPSPCYLRSFAFSWS